MWSSDCDFCSSSKFSMSWKYRKSCYWWATRMKRRYLDIRCLEVRSYCSQVDIHWKKCNWMKANTNHNKDLNSRTFRSFYRWRWSILEVSEKKSRSFITIVCELELILWIGHNSIDNWNFHFVKINESKCWIDGSCCHVSRVTIRYLRGISHWIWVLLSLIAFIVKRLKLTVNTWNSDIVKYTRKVSKSIKYISRDNCRWKDSWTHFCIVRSYAIDYYWSESRSEMRNLDKRLP